MKKSVKKISRGSKIVMGVLSAVLILWIIFGLVWFGLYKSGEAGLRKVEGESALFCLGYNIERARNLLGFQKMMWLMTGA